MKKCICIKGININTCQFGNNEIYSYRNADYYCKWAITVYDGSGTMCKFSSNLGSITIPAGVKNFNDYFMDYEKWKMEFPDRYEARKFNF